MKVFFPSECQSLSGSVSSKCDFDAGSFVQSDFGDELLHFYQPHGGGARHPLPNDARMCNKWPAKRFRGTGFRSTVRCGIFLAPLRNITVDFFALRSRCPIVTWFVVGRSCKSIARTLWTNHCQWVGLLLVRGRCWSSRERYFRDTRVLENLLYYSETEGRSFAVCKEGIEATGGGDPVPAWFDSFCVCGDFCQCNLVGVGASGRPRIHQQPRLASSGQVVCQQQFSSPSISLMFQVQLPVLPDQNSPPKQGLQ